MVASDGPTLQGQDRHDGQRGAGEGDGSGLGRASLGRSEEAEANLHLVPRLGSSHRILLPGHAVPTTIGSTNPQGSVPFPPIGPPPRYSGGR